MLDVADAYAGGKFVSVLEGGYDPEILADCVEVHLAEMLKRRKKRRRWHRAAHESKKPAPRRGRLGSVRCLSSYISVRIGAAGRYFTPEFGGKQRATNSRELTAPGNSLVGIKPDHSREAHRIGLFLWPIALHRGLLAPGYCREPVVP